VCLGGAEISNQAEDGTFNLRVELFSHGQQWCPTPSCTSTDVEGVKVIGEPSIITDRRGLERDLLLFPYKGNCPQCGVSRLGGFGNYQDGSSPTNTRHVFVFNAGRVRADEPPEMSQKG
jgi:hypothetical protein